jgi:uncharacterized protein YndB with AHSA1/START domain
MATKSSAAGNTRLATQPSLTLKRRLKAGPEKVYAAWTDPEKIARWFGPSQVKAGSVQADIDLRTGGHYRIAFDMADGRHNQVGGVYRDVVPNRKLVFSWAWHTTPERESLVTVSLQSDGDGTLLTLHHEQLFDEAARDGHESGWIGTLDKLETFIA